MQRASFDSMQRAPAYQQSEFEYQQQLHFQQQQQQQQQQLLLQQQQQQQQHYRGAPYGGMHQEPSAYHHQYQHQANASRFDPSSPHDGAGSNYGSGAESQNEDASFNASSADLDSIGRRFDESERRHAQQQQQRHRATDHGPTTRAASGRRVDMNASRESWERDMDSVRSNHRCNI